MNVLLIGLKELFRVHRNSSKCSVTFWLFKQLFGSCSKNLFLLLIGSKSLKGFDCPNWIQSNPT